MEYSQVVLMLVRLVVSDVQSKVKVMTARYLQICFASSPYASYPLCPSGFASTEATFDGYTKRQFTLNRRGRFFLGKEPLGVLGGVEFNEDKTLNITVAKLPDARTILTLQNAEIFVPEMPEKPKNEKKEKKKSNASVKIVAVVVVLILVYGFLFILFKVSTFSGVIIGILVWFCVICKPKSEQMADCDDASPEPCGRSSTPPPRNLSAKLEANSVSNVTTTGIKTTNVTVSETRQTYFKHYDYDNPNYSKPEANRTLMFGNKNAIFIRQSDNFKAYFFSLTNNNTLVNKSFDKKRGETDLILHLELFLFGDVCTKLKTKRTISISLA
uniref:Uncharacterized protein n=1 Tax=Panagrellus redivivus TaxID=6233 RepID=A0A7E4VA19_PANRE